jgi:membrane-anchored glycerophosphoryl diester phosphodiesterase (GDPDase)
MEISDKVNTSLIVSVIAVAMACTHWALSLFFARKTKNYFAVDLKQLWQDSLPFLKNQWPIVTIAMLAASWSQLQPVAELSNRPEVSIAATLLAYGPTVLTWILMLFYVSYLAEPKHPGRVATIGATSLLLYVIADCMIMTFSLIGLGILLAPGLIVVVRSCLFLPIYAIHGHKPLLAIRQSWALTKDRYWLVSSYMGLPAILLICTSICPLLDYDLFGSCAQTAAKNSMPLLVACVSTTQVLSLVIGGLLYKLYERLSAAENNRLNEQ